MTKWAPIIPLIGGFPLGAQKAFGTPPEKIYSYPGFDANDSHYVNYMKGIEYHMLSDDEQYEPLDVIVGTPPCSGLSTMNSGTSELSRGPKCEKNKWMYQIFEDGMTKFQSKVIVIENAPALFTKLGAPVADTIYELCQKHGYSLSLYFTSTHLHGVPQIRKRTFAIAWKSEFAPIMNWYERDKKSWIEYLAEIPADSPQYDTDIDKLILNDPFWNYIKSTTNGDPRSKIIEANCKTAFNYINGQSKLEDCKKWFEDTKNEVGLKLINHAIYKFSINKGIWDSSIRVFDDCMNAVIGKNIVSTIHPIEDRSLTVRECLHMMGFPHDFELLGFPKNVNHIAQNVPVCTAADICREIQLFLDGKLEFSKSKYLKQNNMKKEIDYGKEDGRDLYSI